MRSQRVLVTGGAGFLGSHFVRRALGSDLSALVNVDLLTYAGDLARLVDVEKDPRYSFEKADIASSVDVERLVHRVRPDLIVHYAAESHVTRSETDPERFLRTNVAGTKTLLDAALGAGVKRFVHVSTDEVYGSIATGSYSESDKKPGPGNATSPYARSKAQADDLALSYSDQIEVVVARPTNAFGPWQFPEKALPRWVTRALRGEPLLVWGDGLYIRQWLYAEDFAAAIELLADVGEAGRAYNVGPKHDPEITNIDLARWIVDEMGLPAETIRMTAYDRPDHDRRYAVDPSAIQALGWKSGDVYSQMESTVRWYRDNSSWWERHVAEAESIYSDSGAAR